MSIIYYDYQEINSILNSAYRDIVGILECVNTISSQVSSFPWEDESSAAHFRHTAGDAVMGARKIAEDFNELRETALKVNSNMQEFNESIARQWL